MRALCYEGKNKLRVERVADPRLMSARDAIVRVRLSSVCGADLAMIDGRGPTMERGDVLGHEFVGEIVDLGPEVRKLERGDRVVVVSVIGCGRCFYCTRREWSLCDNSNPNAELLERTYGHAGAGLFGCPRAFGGFGGSHAEFVRVPFADLGAFKVPDGIPDASAIFLSDAFPAGYAAAERCDIQRGDVVAVWGAGAVGQLAVRSAYRLGAGRVICIDRVPERLEMARQRAGAVVVNRDDDDVASVLHELTGGRGPDACIDAAGADPDGRARPAPRLDADEPRGRSAERAGGGDALHEMTLACRKGGVVSVVGTYPGDVRLPIEAAMHKGLTLRMGHQNGQRHVPALLELICRGEIDPSYLLTHVLPLEEGPRGYELFRTRKDACVRASFAPAL
jgi:threonine dehydrogenase-like Zn-dependent dehydrogenase